MKQEDFDYLMRNGEFPSKEEPVKENIERSNNDDMFYTSSDYDEVKTEKIWSNKETKVPFWISAVIILFLALIDISAGTKFDIGFIASLVFVWVIIFVPLYAAYTFIKWLIKVSK